MCVNPLFFLLNYTIIKIQYKIMFVEKIHLGFIIFILIYSAKRLLYYYVQT